MTARHKGREVPPTTRAMGFFAAVGYDASGLRDDVTTTTADACITQKKIIRLRNNFIIFRVYRIIVIVSKPFAEIRYDSRATRY